jgi:hypothetical protein
MVASAISFADPACARTRRLADQLPGRSLPLARIAAPSTIRRHRIFLVSDLPPGVIALLRPLEDKLQAVQVVQAPAARPSAFPTQGAEEINLNARMTLLHVRG